ncbi:hypothetical protein G6F56_005069 [Rhizopus delemar]|nr:hypothetical protein G6F56_005069 [Rhizopus delemar]
MNMSVRMLHYKRIPSYKGYWSQILEQPKPTNITPVKQALLVPVEAVVEEEPVSVKPKEYVFLKGKQRQVPEKPDAPTDCCMSVWDIYQEDMEDYTQKKNALVEEFKTAGERVPKQLEAKQDPIEEMDPSMKAFLEMEKNLK